MSERDNPTGDETTVVGLAKSEQSAKGAANTVQQGNWTAAGPTAHVAQSERHGRPGIMRDGFSMPEADYRLIAEIRAACVELGILPTKSGILRAGLHALHRMEPQELVQIIKSLEPVKTGRPAKK